MKRVLITGGAGFIGRSLAFRMQELGYLVTPVDICSSRNSSWGRSELEARGLPVTLLDVMDRDSLRSLAVGHDIIVHAASAVGVNETIADPRGTAEHLAVACLFAEVLTPDQTLLFTSTSDVYGLHSIVYEGKPMCEDDLTVLEAPQVGRWNYARMKSLCESVLATSAARTVSVRIFNCYGPGIDYPDPRRVIPRFLTQIVSGQPLEINGSGNQSRAFTHIDDLVDGIVAAIGYGERMPSGSSDVFNLGNPHERFSILELANKLADLALEHHLVPARPRITSAPAGHQGAFNDDWTRTPDISKAQRMLGFNPKITLAEGLAEIIAFYHKNGIG